jgi:ligand-binding SRPBCC domain-containing protein
MGRGRFKRYQYDHYFYEMNDRTVLNDKIRFTMPLGFIGSFVGRFIIVPYLSKRMRRRLAMLRKVAQDSREWMKYLPKENGLDQNSAGAS